MSAKKKVADLKRPVKAIRRPKFNFKAMGIRNGQMLFGKAGTVYAGHSVKVLADNRVEFKGKIMSLSGAMTEIKGERALSPMQQWTKGKKGPILKEIYDATYS